MADLGGFSSFDTTDTGKAGDKELQEFLLIEKQKAQFNAQVRRRPNYTACI